MFVIKLLTYSLLNSSIIASFSSISCCKDKTSFANVTLSEIFCAAEPVFFYEIHTYIQYIHTALLKIHLKETH